MKIFLLTVVFIGIAILLLSVKILFKKDGKFPNGHVGSNAEMRKRGIKCVRSQDSDERKMS